MIDNTDAVKLLDSKREDSVFVATMNANNVNFGLPQRVHQSGPGLPPFWGYG